MRNEPIVIYCDRELMDSYSRPARLLHWLTAILLVGSFGLGVSMTRFIEDDQKLRVYSWHEWVGVTIFLATIARLLWRILRQPPPLDLPWIERAGAGVVYVAMYVVLLTQPIVGFLMTTAFGFPVVYLGLVPLPQLFEADRDFAEQLQGIHFALAMVLLSLFAAHMGGVLFHHLIKQDGILQRMLPGQARRATTNR
jgi:cytochrome b561